MTADPQTAAQRAATYLREAGRVLQRPHYLEAADAIDTPRVRSFRATHMVLTPGHPPLYTLREEDAVRVCGERGVPSEVHLCTLDRRTGEATWGFWRMMP